MLDNDCENYDEPEITMKLNKKFHLFAFFIICIAIFISIVFIVVPVLLSFDYNSVVIVSDYRIGRKIVAFYLGLSIVFLTPFLVPIFRQGDAYFYKDRFIVKQFITNNCKTYYYKDIKVTQCALKRLRVERRREIGSNLFSFYKNKYIDGVVFALNGNAIENYKNVEEVLKFIKNNVEEYIER